MLEVDVTEADSVLPADILYMLKSIKKAALIGCSHYFVLTSSWASVSSIRKT